MKCSSKISFNSEKKEMFRILSKFGKKYIIIQIFFHSDKYFGEFLNEILENLSYMKICKCKIFSTDL